MKRIGYVIKVNDLYYISSHKLNDKYCYDLVEKDINEILDLIEIHDSFKSATDWLSDTIKIKRLGYQMEKYEKLSLF